MAARSASSGWSPGCSCGMSRRSCAALPDATGRLNARRQRRAIAWLASLALLLELFLGLPASLAMAAEVTAGGGLICTGDGTAMGPGRPVAGRPSEPSPQWLRPLPWRGGRSPPGRRPARRGAAGGRHGGAAAAGTHAGAVPAPSPGLCLARAACDRPDLTPLPPGRRQGPATRSAGRRRRHAGAAASRLKRTFEEQPS